MPKTNYRRRDEASNPRNIRGPAEFSSGGLPPGALLDSSVVSVAKNVPVREVMSSKAAIESTDEDAPPPSSRSSAASPSHSAVESGKEPNYLPHPVSARAPPTDNSGQEEKTEELPFHD